ncbi:MAG: hypothetical protein ACLRIS_15480 [Flavonifractor plautii]
MKERRRITMRITGSPDDWIEVEAPEELPVKSKPLLNFCVRMDLTPKSG